MPHLFNSGLNDVALNYLQLLGVKVTTTSAKKDIIENPYYPSLLSLTDTFNRYHINNMALEMAPENLDELQPPFVAFLNMPDAGNDFVLITTINKEKVTYLYKNKKPQIFSKSEFIFRYKHIVWVAEADANSGEAEFHKKLALEKSAYYKKTAWKAGAIVLLFLGIAINTDITHAWAFGSLLFIKFSGIITSVLLLAHASGKTNSFVKNICTAGNETSCDKVLSSKASRVMGISLTEVGFFYFGATTLWLLFPAVLFVNKIAWIAIANALAAPYILFSIYYQWKVARKWCPLCLFVQVVLLSELFWSTLVYWSSFRFSQVNTIFPTFAYQPVIICLLFPILAWYASKQLFGKVKDASLYSSAYKRLQHNPEIFRTLLRQQPKAPDGWQHLGISIGNPAAKNTILKVCNPYCKPCAIAHHQLEQLVTGNKDINLKIIFTSTNNALDRSSIVAKHLLAIAKEGTASKTRQSLDDWYLADQKKYEPFADNYPINSELTQEDAKIEAMSGWCNEAGITHTPVIYVNGYKLPENYALEELKHIL